MKITAKKQNVDKEKNNTLKFLIGGNMKKSISIIIVFAIVLLLPRSSNAQEIFDAIRNGDLAKVKELVEKDPQLIKARNTRQSTPLHVAVDLNNEPITRYLIEKGADLNAVNRNNWTSLFYAKKLEIAKLLVGKGADINFSVPNYNYTALIHSILMNRNKEIAEYLLDKGANVPETGSAFSEITAIRAIKIGSIRYFEKILQQGFNPLYESETNSNLLHYASESNSIELIEQLIGKGVSANKTDLFGFTPLHIAAFNGNIEIVKLFVQKGLDINARTNDGRTPYNLAVEARKNETAEYLKSIGADQSPQRFPVLMGEYLGQPKPGKKAVPFAPGIVSSNSQHTYHSAMALTPDGNEMYWSAYIGDEETTTILYAKKVNGKWTKPEIFSKGDVPFISPDGNKLFFIGRKEIQGISKEIIYFRDKTDSGWSEPYESPDVINSLPLHWQVSVDRKGNLYFSARQAAGSDSYRIYYSEFKEGRYGEPKIIEILKDVYAFSPYIAPDGSYLIISKEGEGLCILFRKSDGSWTKEIKLVDSIGVPGECSIVTHDGKYLFFIQSVPYWVDTSFIEELRPKK